MTAIIDYGVGNLFSLRSSLARLGEEAIVTDDPDAIKKADRIILPGVGAFADAAEKLRASGLVPLIKQLAAEGRPLLGICLGMQLLFDRSYEYGEHEGLGLIRGEIRDISEICKDLKVPHMGWNSLEFCGEKHPVFKYVDEGEYVYFVHSFCAVGCEDSLIAQAEYGGRVTAAAASGSVVGLQFHPEKSGDTGLRILKAFCETEAAK